MRRLFLCIFLLCGTANATPILDQSQESGDKYKRIYANSVGGDHAFGQTFTASYSGKLDHIDLYLTTDIVVADKENDPNDSLIVSIGILNYRTRDMSENANTPPDDLIEITASGSMDKLDSVNLKIGDIKEGWNSISFNQSPMLDPSLWYLISLWGNPGELPYPRHVAVGWFYDPSNDAYEGGQMFKNREMTSWRTYPFDGDSEHSSSIGSGDFMFRTYMTPVPEPATLILLVIGLVALTGFGKRRVLK